MEQFESAWERGEQPAIEDYLSGAEGELTEILLQLVQADLQWRLKERA